MKSLFRPFFLLSLFAMITVTAMAQSTGMHAIFKGSAADVKTAVQSNKLVFFVAGIETDQQLQDFIKHSQPYSKGFTMTVTQGADQNMRQCNITFNGTPELKWLQRFFMAVSISEVELGGEKKNVNDFFKAIQ